MQTHDGLQERQNAISGGDTPVLPASSCAQAGESDEPDFLDSKPVLQPRGEKTFNREGRSSTHSVFVLDVNGKPLTPTRPAKARKLLQEGKATKIWSKFGTFGIKLNVPVGQIFAGAALGVDHGTKFEGYSVVVNYENNLNVKLDLPDKKQIIKKVEERRALRRARRFRNCRRRPCRFNSSGKKGFIAPSQKVIVDSRLKVIREFCRIYPISIVSIEDVRFNHAKNRWGKNFSTVEIGKGRVRSFFKDRGIEIREFCGYETADLRELYGYKKTSDKSKDCFESHCSDSLSLALAVGIDAGIDPGPFLVVDDTYRYFRRRLHDTQPAKNGVRDFFSTGTVMGLRKGLLIGTGRGPGRLCGAKNGSYRYYDKDGNRQEIKIVKWVRSSFIIRARSS